MLFRGLSFLLLGASLSVQNGEAKTEPTQQPFPPAREIARDIPYPGRIELKIDARNFEQRIIRARQTITTHGGETITLLYPMWMPGNHAPRGPLQNLAGLRVTGGGKNLAWRRDPVEMAAFHIDVPSGVQKIVLEYALLAPLNSKQGRIIFTRDFVNLPWHGLLFYPAGYYVRRIPVDASIDLPEGWSWSTALAAKPGPAATDFAPTTVADLVDSPLYASRHHRRYQLDGGKQPVFLDVFGDKADAVNASDQQIAVHKEIIRQCDRLFGTRPFDRYVFLLSLSDKIPAGGTEHEQSSENRSSSGYFSRWDALPWTRMLLPHEYIHAWNGKFRRPALTFTADFNTPTRNELLWVYEGLTTYYALVVATRAGMLSEADAHDFLALTQASYAQLPGRSWRSLADTTNSAIFSTQRPLPWPDYQRSVRDYYDEGLLLWLEADLLIREQSQGRRSLDDFMRAFFAGEAGRRTTSTFTFDDLVAGLHAVWPYDWESWLRLRLDRTGTDLQGSLDGSGYRTVFRTRANKFQQLSESEAKQSDHSYSIGMVVDHSGIVGTVRWNGPAFLGGFSSGAEILAVDGETYSPASLAKAIEAAAARKGEITLTVRDDNRVRVKKIPVSDGADYPALETVPGSVDRLGAIFKPL